MLLPRKYSVNFLEEGPYAVMGDASAYNSISAQALDKLLAAHDGDVALLYLYWLSHGDLDEEGAAGALCRTRQDICAAKEKLVRLGLPEGAAALPSSPAPAGVRGQAPDPLAAPPANPSAPRLRATPKARRLAQAKGIDLANVQKATGAEMITEAILEAYLAGGK